MERASFGTRLVAAVVDGLIETLAVGVIVTVLPRGLGLPVAIGVVLVARVAAEGGPSGQSPGKRLAGIRVRDASTGEVAGYGKASVRWVCRIISAAPFLLGFVWMLFDEDRETWHDKLSATAVLRVHPAHPARLEDMVGR